MSPHNITEVVTSEETDDGARQSDSDKKDKSGATSATPSICPSEQQRGEKTIVDFADNDPLNPYNWKRSKKLYVVIVSMVMVMNSTIGSSIASGASAETQRYFGVQSESQMVLPVSIYLIGYVIGPLVFAPLSESYGRKPVMLSTFVVFTAFTLGTALAPTFAGLVVMRLLVGIGASTPMSVIGGIYADIYNTRKARGLVITLFMAATTWGPLIGPIVSGYVSVISWRWSYWCLLIISGATWPFFLFMPETYGPIVLKREARRQRKKTGNPNILAPIELEAFDLRNLLVVVLTRPIRMFFTEAIVLTSCLYLSAKKGSPCSGWVSWTARSDIHWIVPTLSALPFGIGFLLIFMGELNYIVDAYEVFAASAMGAASCSRSLFGVILPFAARPMYSRLGIGWACSVLGFLSLVMALIPFVFIRFGDRIRANSKFCQQLKREKEEKELRERQGRESRVNVQPVSADLEKQV
ncbi:hypothetical protein B0A54_11662 [Friedmanniomyces endolithicus]|uniref:Major facilitator superfamily (MFS) profile domain-containing protein n=1 Tax=Friedmanniomyces endolithicus TaxID=329885 RepID=A0A4U0ULW2_9PEZI|nr:hypothetical protein B0A54_11662 [Friedmanniomyces endolithicus]